MNGCSVKKYIPEDELLYTGAEVKIENEGEVEDVKNIKQQAEAVLRPEPNSKFLGMRPGLYFHYKAQQENPGFINKFFNKRIGEEPVYASDVELNEVEDIILNRMENKGFFYSRVSSAMNENEEKQIAEAVYTVNLPKPYLLENYEVEESDTIGVYQEIQNSISETVIEPGMRFDLTELKRERERIEADLMQKGYYNFNPQFLIFEADTNQYNNRKFDLYLRLKQEVPREAAIPYRVEKVNVYPNYVIDSDSIQRDTVRLEGKNYIQEEIFFRPDRLDPYILIEKGKLYSPEDSRYTSRRLTSIGAYKFVNIRYDEIDSLMTDTSGVLEANIFLSPLNKRSLRAELQAVTKSNDFAGPTLALTYANRNLFHGGEILNLTGKFGYEWQIASGDDRSLSSILVGAEADIIFPRMLFPFDINFDNDWFKYSIPKTKVGVGFNYLSRSELFRMYSITGSYGYLWRANRFITHELTPGSINYVSLGQKTEEFEEILRRNPYLRQSFNQQFIAGLLYSFTYNGMVDANRTHQFFVNANLDLAGQLVDLISGGGDEEPKKFLGLEYAQYAKLDTDIRYHWKVGSDHKIATRLFAGYGLPYGNSDIMPFSKQYFSGGPYSVRAFRIRSLGPGAYDPSNSESGINSYFDQAGNVRLEANVEYRFPIINVLKGAVFADAGNVWHTQDVEDLEEGQDYNEEYIEKGRFGSDFLKEFGAGVGFGLRVDIQNFIIRFDLAAPVRTPWLEEGNRWRFDYDDPVLNFGIGYPF
ncbi:membrane protein [Salinimicrobium marinum]|uniref:Membrane protein n=1 Tax=Salinimicrobium marinum TaxID=680283 RepID=A0A918SBW4_9FLAO|nr:membrane protein [Salinimicrobium marinum]